MKDSKALRAAAALALQAAAMTALSALWIRLSLGLGAPMGGALYDLSMWGLVPLLGLGSAWACVRLGAPYGIAWILPPPAQVAAQWLLTGLLPASPGMPMVTLLASAFGAAAGYEQLRRCARRHKRKNTR